MAREYDIALVGGRGFIASHLLSRISESASRLIVFGRAAPDRLAAHVDFETWEAGSLMPPRRSALPKRVVRTLIYNTAMKGRFSDGAPELKRQAAINAPDFSALCESLALEPQRILTIGSSEEYGPRTKPEEILETDTPLPISSYGRSKLELCRSARLWSQASGNPVLHLCPFVVYGLGQDPKMFLGEIIRVLSGGGTFQMTSGEQWRSFISVEMLVDAIVSACHAERWPFQRINISSPNYFQLKTVAEMVAGIISKGRLEIGAIPYRTEEVWHQKPSLERMNDLLPNIQWQPLEKDIKTLSTGPT